jgi:hypothetical protein
LKKKDPFCFHDLYGGGFGRGLMSEMEPRSCSVRELRVCLESLRDSLGVPADGGIDPVQVEQSWGRFVAARSALLSGRGGRCGLQSADAEDALQELCLDVLKRWQQLPEEKRPTCLDASLAQALFNKAMNIHRQQARHPTEPLGELLGTKAEVSAASEDPADVSKRKCRQDASRPCCGASRIREMP